MVLVSFCVTVLLASIVTTFAGFTTSLDVSGFERLSRQSSSAAVAPIVDLGYARYQGYHDSEFGLDVYKGYDRKCASVIRASELTFFGQDSLCGTSNWEAALAGSSDASTISKGQDPTGHSATATVSSIWRCKDARGIWLRVGTWE